MRLAESTERRLPCLVHDALASRRRVPRVGVRGGAYLCRHDRPAPREEAGFYSPGQEAGVVRNIRRSRRPGRQVRVAVCRVGGVERRVRQVDFKYAWPEKVEGLRGILLQEHGVGAVQAKPRMRKGFSLRSSPGIIRSFIFIPGLIPPTVYHGQWTVGTLYTGLGPCFHATLLWCGPLRVPTPRSAL